VTAQGFESKRLRTALMAGQANRIRAAHRFLASHSAYPLALSSLLACGIWIGRVIRSHSLTGGGLIWNLFLAWVPYLCSLWIVHLHHQHPRKWWRLLIPSALWLIFFPNAPYIVTDLWHLHERPPIPLWYDLGLFVTFAWTGCFLGLVSLGITQSVVKTFVGRMGSWVFAFIVLVLSGMGIYLGRFLGWNSWDLFLDPGAVLGDVAGWLLHPRHHLQTFGFTLLFAAFLMVCYLTFTSVQQHERS